MFRLKLFGSASIEGPDGPVTGRAVQRRRLALLALLAIARQRGLTRDKLIGYLWPDADPDRARHQLSDSVYRINQAVGGEAVMAVGDELRLSPQGLPADAWEFADAIERGDWERAVELHAAPFLDGFFMTDADELERWVDAQRERLVRERARALEELAEAAERADDLARAVNWWRTLAAQDPHSSRVALRLMRVLDRSGDRAAALQHARIHATMLEDDLGLPPDTELTAFADQLRAQPKPRPAPAPERAAPVPVPVPAPAPVPVPDSHPHSHSLSHWKILALVLVLVLALAVYFSGAARSTPAPTIAVLPFADLSAGGAYEYFADGITEELIALLGQVHGLNVVGRTSAFAFKGRQVDVRDVASQLNVTNVLEGSVRHSGDRLRVVAQLSDARNGYQLWTETYEVEASNVFAIQDEISRQIMTHLRGRFGRGAAAHVPERSGATDDAEAFNLYLQGRFQWHRRTERSLLAAAGFFRSAVERAPDYARAYAGLGDAYAVLGFYDFMPPREAFPAAAAAANRALELEPSLGEPHATLAYVALYYDWDWARAEREFRRAIELNPGYSTAHQWYGNLLTAMGRFDEAVAEMSEAMRLDPLSLIANAALCWVHHYSGEYATAVEQCSRALALDDSFALAWLWRAWSYEELGEFGSAIRDYQRAVQLSDGSANNVTGLARGYARAGQRDRALALLAELTQRTGYVPPYELARLHVALGDADSAVEALEAAYAHRSHSMAFLAVDPQLIPLRSDSRFRALIQRLGLHNTPGGRRLQ